MQHRSGVLIGRRAAIALLGLVAGCAGPPAPEPTDVPAAPTATPAPSPSPTPIPQLVLITEGDAPYAERLRAWAAERGWETTVINSAEVELALSDPSLEARAVVVHAAPISQPVAAPLVMVDVPGITPQRTLSSVGIPGARYDQAGFLAGVMVGLTTQVEWVGEVTRGDDPQTTTYLAGFGQGLKIGCPRCRLVSLSIAEATVDGFRGRGVDVVFVPPGPDAYPIATTLAEAGVWIVWVGELPEGLPRLALAGRVAFDPEPLVLAALEALAGGAEGQAWPYAIENGGLILADINQQAISPGRFRLLEEAYQAVASGELDIGLENP